MKYVHVFTKAESADVDEGSLHWPWVAPDRVELHDRVARARSAAREEVAARVAVSPAPKTTRTAARKVRTTRRRAARAAAAATTPEPSSEASSDA